MRTRNRGPAQVFHPDIGHMHLLDTQGPFLLILVPMGVIVASPDPGVGDRILST